MSTHNSVMKGKKLHFNDVNEMARYISTPDYEVDLIDAVFCDPLGTWHHCTYAPSQCSSTDLQTGFAFDGSSIKLFTTVDQSDMLMVPDPRTCWIDPFCTRHRTLHVVCSITGPSGIPFNRCPRQIAIKASAAVHDLGIGDCCIFGPEPEFFVFDHVRVNVCDEEVAVELTGEELPWVNSEKRGSKALDGKANLGTRLPKMYFPVGPADTMMQLRGDMLLTMRDVGLDIEKHHHECAPSQCELGFKFDKLVETADNVMTYKYVVKNVSKIYNKTATFMPKPLQGHAGSGMHVHQSIWSGGRNLFFDKDGDWFGLSKVAMHYIAGILHHSWAVLAFTNPTTNSYKRLVPGFEAPCRLVYSKGNRSAAIRIPLSDDSNPRAKRLECRFPDGASNPYLAFSVLLLAGVDGIVKKMTPPPAMDRNIFALSDEEKRNVPSTPSSLSEAIDALEKDHDFLLRNNVFDAGFIASYIALKRAEIQSVDAVPHPKEFQLYYNI